MTKVKFCRESTTTIMAARVAVDTANNEGEENNCNGLDVIEWLKTNRLNKLVEYVEENELTIRDFLTYDEEDMEFSLLIYIYII